MVATPSAIAAPQRVVASNFFKVVLANVDILAASLHRPSPPQGACAKHSRVARNDTSDIACRATITGQASHIENSTIKMHHVEGYTDLEWPIDARNRRNVSCACFSHAQTRPEITRTQKVLATVRQTARATPGAPRTARPSKCAISQSKHETEAACPCTQPQKSSARVIWTRPKTASRDLFAVIRCS